MERSYQTTAIKRYIARLILLLATHTCGSGHCLPVVRKALVQLCNLDCHTQAHLAQFVLVLVHELNDLVATNFTDVHVVKQHASLGNLLDTQDLVRVEGERVYFLGMASGAINVGGNKVNPEEVENHIRNVCGV